MSRVRNHPGPEEGFFLLANKFARDPRVTARAARVYIYLRSHRDGWETNVRNIGKAVGMGKNTVATALLDLEALGYVAREQQRDEQGRVTGMDYVTYAEPCPQNRDADAAAVAQNQGCGDDLAKQREPAGGNWNPESGNPKSGNPKTGTYKKTIPKEHQPEEHQPENNPPNPPRGADGARAAEGGQQPLLPGIPEGQAPTGHQPPAPQPVGQPDLQAEFERWWATCPRKIGKGRWPEGNRKGTGARAAFIRAREQASLQQLLDGMARSVAAWKAEGRAADKLPHPSTWLNQARWEDEGAGEWQQQAPQPRNTNTLAAWLGTDTAPQVGQQGHQPGPVIEHNEGNTPWL